MPEDAEVIPYSLCDDCPLNDACGTSKLIGQVITCGKRAKHEAKEEE